MSSVETPKKVIAIFCENIKMGSEPLSNEHYWDAYQDVLLYLKAKGAQAYLVTDNNSYRGYGKFTAGYTLDKKSNIDELVKVENITADVVIDRGGFIGRDVLTINDAFVQKIATNKIEMYKHFSKFQPFSVICENHDDAINAFNQVEGDNIVVKEPESYGGYGVYIGPKEEILEKIPDNYPLLVQEFYDTTSGIPGLVTGVHDMRITVCGGQIIGCYIRKGKEGTYYSNVAQGGSFFFVDIEKIPVEVESAVYEIDDQFKKYPRYYSADFIHSDKGWKMLELNALLAFVPAAEGKNAEVMLDKFTDYLIEVA